MNLVEFGVLLVFIGVILVTIGAITSGNAEFGGVVMIGPIPVVFGNSRNAMVGALVLVLVMILLFFILSQIQM